MSFCLIITLLIISTTCTYSFVTHHYGIIPAFQRSVLFEKKTTSVPQAIDEETDDDHVDDDCWTPLITVCDEEGCRPVNKRRGFGFTSSLPPNSTVGEVFLVSDNTGSTVKNSFGKCINQFDSLFEGQGTGADSSSGLISNIIVKTRVFTFVRSEMRLTSIIRKAKEEEAMIMFTFADPSLRGKTIRMCSLSKVPVVDVLGPSIDVLSSFFGSQPVGVPASIEDENRPRRMEPLSDAYFRRIEAVEYTLKADDAQAPWLLPTADVVIVGVSRTGKTPLSIVISQMLGLRVANVPLVLECPVPKELIDVSLVDPERVFCLKISPVELKKIRITRLERRNVLATEKKRVKSGDEDADRKSNYADRAYVMNDLKNARDLATEYGWTEIDVTGRAVEETASYIGELMNERFGELFVC